MRVHASVSVLEMGEDNSGSRSVAAHGLEVEEVAVLSRDCASVDGSTLRC